MQDKELYQKILGLESPGRVGGVDLDVERQEIVIAVEHLPGTRFCCPSCGLELGCYDHSESRDWRHLDSCQFKTILRAALPRVQFPEHGVWQVAAPWAEGNSRFTILLEVFAINLLKITQNVEGASELLRTGWKATWNIIKRAVERGQARKQDLPTPRIGIDEKSFAKRQSYVTLLYDLDHSTVEAIAFGNDTAAGNACFSRLSSSQLASVEAVAMDMSAAYVKSAREMIPLAEEKIVHDRFHIMKLMNEGVDKVRRAENRSLLREGDDQLSGTRFLWLTSQENLSEKAAESIRCRVQSAVGDRQGVGLQRIAAGTLGSTHRCIGDGLVQRLVPTGDSHESEPAEEGSKNDSGTLGQCRKLLHSWNHQCRCGSNKSKIQSIKRRVGGFRNPENYKNAIFFYCGGLDLHPR